MDPEPTLGTVPLHLRIAEDLRNRMESGTLRPGDSLPPVREIAHTWDCTAGTAREAIAVLRREGRITSGRGKPAEVRQIPKRIELIQGWANVQKENVLASEELRSQVGALELTTGTPLSETEFKCSYTRVEAEYELAKDLEIQPGAEVLKRRYETLSRQTGFRMAFSLSWIPVTLIEANSDLLDESNEPWPGGHMHQLYTVGIEVNRMVRRVTAISPSPGVQQRWGMETGTPMLVVRSKSIDTRQRVVEMSDAYYPADRTEIGFFEDLPRLDKINN